MVNSIPAFFIIHRPAYNFLRVSIVTTFRRQPMARGRLLVGLIFLALTSVVPAGAQTFPGRGYFGGLISQPVVQSSIPGPEGLRDYVADGKLRLTLADEIGR